MSLKLIKSLRSEKTLAKSPSVDFYNYGSSSAKNLHFGNSMNENLTILQKTLEETRINFLGEKHQKLEKMSQIQDLFSRNQRLNGNLHQATFKIKKKEEINQKLELENRKCKKLLEEIGVDYDKSEPLIDKIMSLQSQNETLTIGIQSLKEVLSKKEEEISQKNTNLQNLQNVQNENDSLKSELNNTKQKLQQFSTEINSLRKLFQSTVNENEKKSLLSVEKIENLEREKNDLLIKFEDLGIQLKTSQNLVGNLTLSLISAETQLLEFNRMKQANSQLETEKFKKDKEILTLNKTIIDLKEKITPFLLKKTENLDHLLCRLCRDPIEEAITVIPCGHSYCTKCEIGYNTQKCKSCGCCIEAIYKNDLMNELKKWFISITKQLV